MPPAWIDRRARLLGVATFLLAGVVDAAEPTAHGTTPTVPTTRAASPTTIEGGADGRGPDDLVQRLEGVYKVRFQNANVSGDTGTSENILEIVPYGANAAYVRVHLEFYNGDTCAVWGIATVQGEKLVYQERTPVDPPRACHLEITVKGGGIVLGDTPAPDGNHSCRAYCGARGSMSAKWPYATRRAIRYMRVLLNSREYKAAVAEFQRQPTGTPAAPSSALE